MKELSVSKWENLAQAEGMLFFAQAVCELLDDSSLDSYKAPALNLHLSLFELRTLIKYYCNGRIKKGVLNFSINECKNHVKNTLIFGHSFLGKVNQYLTDIEATLSKHDENVNRSRLKSLSIAARTEVGTVYWQNLKDKLLDAVKGNREKSSIYALAADFATEVGRRGFSRQYVLGITKKFFFNERTEPLRITTYDQLIDYLHYFDQNNRTWSVCFKASSLPENLLSYLKPFEIKHVEERPKEFYRVKKYTEFIKGKGRDRAVYCVQNVKAKDPHTARDRAEGHLKFYVDTCRFHNHAIEFEIQNDSFVCDVENKKYYRLKQSKKPMECGTIFKRAEGDERLKTTIEILLGKHFSITAARDFAKVLDFHHAAMISANDENQLLDLWAALEGFLPSPNSESDRIVWYTDYIIPSLVLNYNEKIFRCLTDDLCNAGTNVNEFVQSLPIEGSSFVKVVNLVVARDFDDKKEELISLLDSNPLLRYRVYSLNKSYKSTKRIRRVIREHRQKLEWHIRRIYTLRNHIAHNASTLPYLRNLVENLHDYLDTLIISVSSVGKRVRVFDIQTALEVIKSSETEYIKGLEGEHRLTYEDCIDYMFGANSVLSPFYDE
ncbi:hypothetical protein [Maridesulfovibrio sp.]|uniref:hypothetical protein n=1 Tax=Maridesulfovibrio sp. TaxID=2795000 RepID=UPI002A186C15|nr:hypothetical protein [Maridesulfovibrio sp.]